MKSLTTYIQESKGKVGGYYLTEKFGGDRTLDEFMDLNGINESTITKEDLYAYECHNFTNIPPRTFESYIHWINETLKSYNTDNLIKRIKGEFPEITNIEKVERPNSKIQFCIIHLPYINKFTNGRSILGNKLTQTKEGDDLTDIIHWHGYEITLIERRGKEIFVFCEPKYSKDVRQDVIDKGDGFVYHITSKSNIQSIKKCGLRPKVGKTPKSDPNKGYRYFSERVFLIQGDKDKRKLRDKIESIIEDKQLQDDYVILKINVYRHENFGIFIDTTYDHNNNLYTFTLIPPKYITFIYNIEDL